MYYEKESLFFQSNLLLTIVQFSPLQERCPLSDYPDMLFPTLYIYDYLIDEPAKTAVAFFETLFDDKTIQCDSVENISIDGHVYEKRYRFLVPFSNRYEKGEGNPFEPSVWCQYSLYSMKDTIKYVELASNGSEFSYAKDSIIYWIRKFTFQESIETYSNEHRVFYDSTWWNEKFILTLNWDNDKQKESTSEFDIKSLTPNKFVSTAIQIIKDSITANFDFQGTIHASNTQYEGSISFASGWYNADSNNQWSILIAIKSNK